MKRGLPATLIALTLCLLVATGCSSQTAGGESAPEEQYDLVFSDAKVECEKRDGWFGARNAGIQVTASVKNQADVPLKAENMPVLESEDGEREVEPKLSEEELESGESCEITYEGELPIEDGKVAGLLFSSKMTLGGADELEQEINERLKGVADAYAKQDADEEAEKEEARKQREEESAAAEKEKEEAKKAVEACKGKTADEGLKAAENAGYSSSFKDSEDVDVSNQVKDSKNGSDVHKAKILEVSIESGFLGTSVTFKLDYVDPDAAKERENKAKEEADKEKKKADDKKRTESCEGKSSQEAYEVIKDTDLDYQFVDKKGNDVTERVVKSTDENATNAKVTKVEFSDPAFLSSKERVVLSLDFTRLTDEEVIQSCVGKSASDALSIVKKLGYSNPTFEYRAFRSKSGKWDDTVDYTTQALSDRYAGSMGRAKITEVSNLAKDHKDYPVKFIIDRPLAIASEDDETLAKMLSTSAPSQDLIDEFNDKFEGVDIEFDGCVVSSERSTGVGYYDYVIRCGDYPGDGQDCPVMHLKHAGNLGMEVLDTPALPEGDKAVGCNCRFYIEVKSFYSDTMEMGLKSQYAMMR